MYNARIPYTTPTVLVNAYAEWAQRLADEGWTPYLLTFMFRHLNGSPTAVAAQMEQELERIYATFVSRVVRKPCAPSQIMRLPVWFCCPDFPVPKHARKTVSDVIINDGRHMHAIALQPPWSRFTEDLGTHFETFRHTYIRAEQGLIRMDVEPITHRMAYVVGYGFKSVLRGRIGEGATLILPRSRFEVVSGRTNFVRPGSSSYQVSSTNV